MLLTLFCKCCGKEFQRHHYFVWSTDVFCSVNCRNQYVRKASLHLVKNQKDTRYSILNRDHYVCKNCGDGSVRLNIHHIDGSGDWSDWEKSNNDKDNLITLCSSCHLKLHYNEKNKRDIV